jgi:hypothetical protein
MLHRAVWQKTTDAPELLAACIIRANAQAANTSETSVNIYKTIRQNSALRDPVKDGEEREPS